MREHKYRAWDKKEKRWLGVNLHMSVTDGTLWWQFGYGCEILSAAERENIALLEYIGRKDINGKEIYEGNILKDEHNRILLVEWRNHSFSFKAITKTNFFSTRDINQWFENGAILPEIIGNIYNNPELMEANQ